MIGKLGSTGHTQDPYDWDSRVEAWEMVAATDVFPRHAQRSGRFTWSHCDDNRFRREEPEERGEEEQLREREESGRRLYEMRFRKW